MEEKVDILLTTYNTKIEYLEKQIASILNQTYKNINLIISDDASTKKDVIETLKKYKKEDERITLFLQEKNLGYNRNFEFLLKQSTANYICFSDHDDIWYEEKIEKSLKVLKEQSVDLVYCNAKQIDKDGIVIQENYFKYKNVPLIKGKDKIAIMRCVGIGCSQMITKKVKNRMLPFTDKVMAHDWLAAFIANEENGICYIEEPLFEYRLHETNVFGGRNLSQNLSLWKKENGSTYKSYLKYREKKVINKAYLDGAEMCLQYSKNKENKELIEKAIKYYKNIKKSKYINFRIFQYMEILKGKNMGKKMIKEILIFHLPILGFVIFKM